MDSKDAVILGYDAVSPLGIDLKEQWELLCMGKSGIGPLTRFPVDENFPVKISGEVAPIDHLPHGFLKPREQAKWTSPLFKYSMLTVSRALETVGIEITPDIARRTAVTYSTAVGGLDAILNADRKMIAGGKLPHPFTNPNACINMPGGKISMLTGAKGPILTTITACATGLTSLLTGELLLKSGMADMAICGAVDFPLVEPIVAGFATMNGAYAPPDNGPQYLPEQASRPFSMGRKGFVVSEGAGCIIIATKEFADHHHLAYTVKIAGHAMTSDADHFVAPNGETVRRCMALAMENAGIQPGDIDAVNAHAASTKVGDRVEFDALEAVFKHKIPPITANKSMIGHAMGASSAIESIFSIHGMDEGILPPTINHIPDPDIRFDNLNVSQEKISQEFLLKNAFGFGGCNACAVFQKIH